jgi:hypothetical protein
VKEATVPNVFPNIRGEDYGTSQNNIISFNTSSTDYNVTLPEGQYRIDPSPSVPPEVDDFVGNLQDAINAVSPSTVDLSYNELTGRIEFQVTAGADVTFYASSLMADVLGLTSDLLVTLGLPDPIPSNGLVDLSGYQNVYIHSKEIADTAAIDGDFGLISVVTPINLSDAPYNSYAYRKNDDDELSLILYEQPRNLSRINIKLRDNKGNILPIGTHNMNLVLKAYLSSG